jgi:hypothetical protein
MLVVVLVAALALVVSAPAQARSADAPVALRLTFRLIARGVSDLGVSGRYVGFTQTTSTRQRTVERFVLLDDRTGKRIAIPADCDAGVVGDPWVALYCSSSLLRQSYEVFNVQRRKMRHLPCVGLCRQDYYFQNIVAVGASWFEVEVEPHEPCGDGVHNTCGPTTFAFYNARTGAQRVPFVSDSRIIDLDSPTLARPLCRPLIEPAGYAPTSIFPPPLTFYGSFALAQQASGIYIERCRSHLHVPVVRAPYEGGVLANAQAVAFCSQIGPKATPMAGFFLPSLQRFTIGAFSLTAAARPVCPLLGPRQMYAVDAQSRLWAALFPSKPPARRVH